MEVSTRIDSIALAFPAKELGNDQLAREFQKWDAEKIASKTGIQSRYIVSDSEYSSDLATRATEKVIKNGGFVPNDFDLLVVISQTPDYLLPGLASLVHYRVGFPEDMKILDINQGCSGFPYGLWLVNALIEAGEASRAILVTADTYSRILSTQDQSTRTIFGDGASASIIEKSPSSSAGLVTSKFGTDGSGSGSLIAGNGIRLPRSSVSNLMTAGGAEHKPSLFMDGPAILKFALRVVPQLLEDLMSQAGLRQEDVDYFVFHQANAFILKLLRESIGLPVNKFPIQMEKYGNTVSTTLPTVIRENGLLAPGRTLALVGFGVGLSWGGVIWKT